MSHRDREFQTCRHTARTRGRRGRDPDEAATSRGTPTTVGASSRSRERPGAQCPSGAPEGPTGGSTVDPPTSEFWPQGLGWNKLLFHGTQAAAVLWRPRETHATSENYYENARGMGATLGAPATDRSPVCPTERAPVPWEDSFASCLWDRPFRGGGLILVSPDG